MTSGSEANPGSGASADPVEARAYLRQVVAEIDEEVARRRRSGELPPQAERELDALFLRFSPTSATPAGLEEALRLVDASSFIDPVVPVASSKSGGAYVKRGIRQASLWYMSFVTQQMSEFASATSRVLRSFDDQIRSIRRELELQRVPAAPVIEVDWAHGPSAWWASDVVSALQGRSGRVLHAAAGDGWLVARLREAGLDAYGVEPRPGVHERSSDPELDLREEPVLDHLRAVAPGDLAAVVFSGIVDGMTPPEREMLTRSALEALGPSGVLVIHSLSRGGWSSDRAPLEADIAAGHPLRRATWAGLLDAAGFDVAVHEGREGLDYLVVAIRSESEGR
jgi:hypothetical protein